MKRVKNHFCVFSSLVFAGISFSLQKTPISLEISVVLVMQVAAGGSHSVGFGILPFCFIPLDTATPASVLQGYSCGPKDPLAILLVPMELLSLLAL